MASTERVKERRACAVNAFHAAIPLIAVRLSLGYSGMGTRDWYSFGVWWCGGVCVILVAVDHNPTMHHDGTSTNRDR
jgi:hypothetical protein